MSNAPIASLAFESQHRETFEPFFTIEFRQSVAELEEVLRVGMASSGNLHLAWPADAIAYANHMRMQGHVHWYEGMGLVSAHTPISEATIRGVLDTVRTRVLDLALANRVRRSERWRGCRVHPRAIEATQIFYTKVMGGNVALGSQNFSQTIESPPKNVDDLVERLQTLGLDEQLLTELRDAILEDEQTGESSTYERAWNSYTCMARQGHDAGGPDSPSGQCRRIWHSGGPVGHESPRLLLVTECDHRDRQLPAPTNSLKIDKRINGKLLDQHFGMSESRAMTGLR